jgi:uncharacterized protein YsxB (DUF464 family)
LIVIDAAVDGGGLLRSLDVSGHAGAAPRGSDIVCAAVSVLVKGFAAALDAKEGIAVRAEAPRRGSFHLEAGCEAGAGADVEPFFAGASALALAGFYAVSGEYPRCCAINITEKGD